jgi:hypothetical protein
MNYRELYEKDQRYRHYVDACAKEYGLTVDEMLQYKIIQNVGDYYAKTPTKEEQTVSTMKSGGC